MADQEQLAILKEGVREWNVWREKNPDATIDLIGADLSEADLSEADLIEANLSRANLSRANLRKAILIKANLSGANLSGAHLGGAILVRANLSGTNFSVANLSWADLSWADLRRADLSWANLSEANLSGADLSEANLSDTNLSVANLSHTTINRATLSSERPMDAVPGVQVYEPQWNERSGGIDLASDKTIIGGDAVGRDKITYVNAPNAAEVNQQRRVESMFPAQPVMGQIESLYVQVKIPESPVGPEARVRTIGMPFKADVRTGAALPTPFKIKVIAPGFRIYGRDEKTLRVLPDEDSTELEYQLQCETDRAVKIQVEVYAESGFLGQVDLPVTPILTQQIPLPSERMWMRGVFILGALPDVSISTSW